jgi:protein involved in polysaccharide export with SLBB domain
MNPLRQATGAGARVFVLGTILLVTAGCGSTAGNPFSFFTIRHPLSRTAREVRQPVPPADVPRELNKTVLAAYYVEPGDGLLIQPADLDSPVRLPADQTILPDGTIDLGRYGRIRVAGRTVEEIEGMVQTAVRAVTKDAGSINVRLLNRASKVYYVLGEVNSPGAFPLAGRETVLDAIVAAGGLTERASLRNIILSRPTPPDGCRIVLPVCYQNIVQLGDTTTNYQVAPGDRIFVASKRPFECLCHDDNDPCGPCSGPQSACPLSQAGTCHSCAPAVAPTPVPADHAPPAFAPAPSAPPTLPPR